MKPYDLLGKASFQGSFRYTWALATSPSRRRPNRSKPESLPCSVCVFTVPSPCLAMSERSTWVMYSKSLAWLQSLWMAERSLSIRKKELRYTRWRPNWSPLPSGLPHHLCPLSCYLDCSGFMSYPHTIEGGNMILVSIVKESNTQDFHLYPMVHDCSEISSWIMLYINIIYHGPIFQTNHWPTGATWNRLKIHVF